MYCAVAWLDSNPTLAAHLSLIKLWVAPKSNSITVGLCAFREFSKSSEINLSLPDLHDSLFTFALVVMIRILTLGRLLVSGAIPDEVLSTSACIATIVAIWTVGLLNIWP